MVPLRGPRTKWRSNTSILTLHLDCGRQCCLLYYNFNLGLNFLRHIYWRKRSSSFGCCLRGTSSKQSLPSLKRAEMKHSENGSFPLFCFLLSHNNLTKWQSPQLDIKLAISPLGWNQKEWRERRSLLPFFPCLEGNGSLPWPDWYMGRTEVPLHSFHTILGLGDALCSFLD